MARTARAAQLNPAGWRAMVRGIAQRVSILFIVVVALFAGSFALELSDEASSIVKTVATIAIVLQAALIADAIVAIYALQHVARQDAAATSIRNAISLIKFLARTAIWSLAILMVLDNLGLDVTTLVAGLGIGGIAIALAAQNILGDLFASLAIILDKPFVVGDFIIFGEFSGTVERVGVKTTRLRSLSGEQLVVPNADLLSTRLRNMRRMHERRAVFTLGVVYETPYETLKRIPQMLQEIVEAEETARFDRAHFA
ncbi:MAG: mechanosensitive ion channel family protein, partial [Rhizobiales bacterium]|nr:mechanosensitive ion channel family protein [Hyphomicrobiales bacterium]